MMASYNSVKSVPGGSGTFARMKDQMNAELKAEAVAYFNHVVENLTAQLHQLKVSYY